MKHATVAVWVTLALAGGAQARDLVQVYDDAVRPQLEIKNNAMVPVNQAFAALVCDLNGRYTAYLRRVGVIGYL